MKKKKRSPVFFNASRILLFLILSSVFFLYGCSRNSDLDDGILEDSALGGVDFQTLSYTGTTDVDGMFKYFNGRSITFSLGDVALGSVMPKQRMSIIDLVAGAEDVTNQTVTNMARFLQSLDDDDNPDNGILITQAVKDEMQGMEINFAKSASEFESDVAALFDTLGKTLRTAEQAQDHLRATVLGPFTHSVASGDPRPDSVVLWTRAYDAGNNMNVTLNVAADKEMNNTIVTREFVARAEYDNCIKVKIDDLSSNTFYYYQFSCQKDNNITYYSPVGRTKTAPDETANVDVKWALFSGQDYVGRYYNSFAHLLNTYTDEKDLDFLVHVGDYVYENERDPSFQSEGRNFKFTDVDGSIERGDPAFHSAKSLANYRTLYKTFRSDMMLQKLHERYPMIVIWDDHEFSDDGWQTTATYFDGKKDEADEQRKQNAERAFFEYIPCEIGLGDDDELAVTNDILYPNEKIYRDFQFGANAHLIMSDYRTYRPDHLIPEDAFPGKIVIDQAAAQAMLGPAFALYAGSLEPYVDIDSPLNAVLKATMVQIVTAMYAMENEDLTPSEAAAKAADVAQGNIAARYINGAFAGAGLPEPLDGAAIALLDVGVGYLTMGKTGLYSDFGSRYLVSQDLFTLYANYLNLFVDPSKDEAFGDDGVQETWIKNTLEASTATWKIFGSSVSFTPMILDLTHESIAPLIPEGFPDALRARLQMNADQWEGFPVKRNEFLNYLSTIDGAAIMSGDIHASFACDHGDRGGTNRVYEFTGTSVSSGTIQEFVGNATDSLGLEGVDPLVSQLGLVFQVSSIGNPNTAPSQIVYDSTNENGYVVLEATGSSFFGTYHHYPTEFVHDRFYDNFEDLAGEFTATKFEIKNNVISEVQ